VPKLWPVTLSYYTLPFRPKRTFKCWTPPREKQPRYDFRHGHRAYAIQRYREFGTTQSSLCLWCGCSMTRLLAGRIPQLQLKPKKKLVLVSTNSYWKQHAYYFCQCHDRLCPVHSGAPSTLVNTRPEALLTYVATNLRCI
jgi:hypothetical protein